MKIWFTSDPRIQLAQNKTKSAVVARSCSAPSRGRRVRGGTCAAVPRRDLVIMSGARQRRTPSGTSQSAAPSSSGQVPPVSRNAGGGALSGVAVLLGLVGMVALCVTGTLLVEGEPSSPAPAGEDGLKGLAASFDEAAGRRAYEHVEALAGLGVKTTPHTEPQNPRAQSAERRAHKRHIHRGPSTNSFLSAS